MSQTEIIKALEDYMHASLGVNGEITRRAKEAIEALKANCSEKPNNSPTEMSGTSLKVEKILANALAIHLEGTRITCDKLLWTDWCQGHCKEGQDSPDDECWMRYAEVIRDET